MTARYDVRTSEADGFTVVDMDTGELATYADNYGYYTPGTVYDGVTAFSAAQQTALGVTPVSTNAFNYTFIPAEADSPSVVVVGNLDVRDLVQRHSDAAPVVVVHPEHVCGLGECLLDVRDDLLR